MNARMISLAKAVSLTLALAMPCMSAQAQIASTGQQAPALHIPAPVMPSAMRLYPGVAPGSEDSTQVERWEQSPDQRRVRNVTIPELIPVLPSADKATGTAIIIAPGGAFRRLAIDNEGFHVATWLAQQGIAAFVLKYRVMETPADPADVARAMAQDRAQATTAAARTPTFPLAIDDARRAMQLVRDNATRFQLKPGRIGMLGFSAGAMTTLEVVMHPDASSKPDFAGMIYGPLSARPVPADAPPVFLALAADDPLFSNGDFGLVEAWLKARKPVEFHLYGQGAHGFGMKQQNLTSDLWQGQFLAWLKMRGLTVR